MSDETPLAFDAGDRTATDGRVVYAVGDIHGRAVALGLLLAEVAADARRRPADVPVTLVFLGDYVDRGPCSRDVLDALSAVANWSQPEVIALKGNHEAALLKFLDDPTFGPKWASYGGLATLAAYGVEPPRLKTQAHAWEPVRDLFLERLPPAHLAFLRGLATWCAIGDYAFVHAGVRPGIPLEAQSEEDLLWIRDPFLEACGPHDKVIVHGHTPTEGPFDGRYRIGVDTGAYATGVLTAVRLEGQARRFMQASAGPERALAGAARLALSDQS